MCRRPFMHLNVVVRTLMHPGAVTVEGVLSEEKQKLKQAKHSIFFPLFFSQNFRNNPCFLMS